MIDVLHPVEDRMPYDNSAPKKVKRVGISTEYLQESLGH